MRAVILTETDHHIAGLGNLIEKRLSRLNSSEEQQIHDCASARPLSFDFIIESCLRLT